MRVRLGLIYLIMRLKYGFISDIGTSSFLNGADSWLGAAINATVNTAGIITNAIQAKRQRIANIRLQRETNAQNLALAREQNAWSERMINEQNSYNSPENQRKLLEEGGYNPALFSPDGMTQNTIPSSANLANQVAPRYEQDMSGFNQHLSQIANSGLTYLQAKQLEALTDKTVNESTQIVEMTKQIISQTHCTDEQARLIAVNVDKANVEMQQMRENILNLQATRSSIYQGIAESKNRIDISNKQYQLQLKLTKAQIAKYFSDIGVNDITIEKIAKDITYIAAQTVRTGKEVDILDLDWAYKRIVNYYVDAQQRAQLDKIQADIYNQLSGHIYKDVQAFIRDITASFSAGIGQGYRTRYGDYGSQLYDRINSQGGYYNIRPPMKVPMQY